MEGSFSGESRTLIEDELDKILNSRQFASAPAVRAFLKFVVDEVIAGRGDRIKAYTIATEAFGRNPQFDPSNDTIVRTTAGRVRRALEAYHRECDTDSRVVISLPKGGYAPSFEFRDTHSPSHPSPSGWSSRIRQSFFRPGILMAACIFAVVAIGFMAFPGWEADWRETERRSRPNNVVIDVLPVDHVGQKTQSLARAIDIRLAPALTRIGMAEISPPGASPGTNEGVPTRRDSATKSISFILKPSITSAAKPEWFWQLIDAESGRLLWASKEQLSGTNPASIDRAVDNVAFQVLGRGGAIPSALERYRGEIFSKPTCLSRAQIIEVIENDIVYPEMRDCLERIVTSSPNDASAWAVLSNFYSARSHFYSAGNREERATLVERAERAAEKAAELGPEAYLTKVALMVLSLRQGRIAEFDALQQEIRKRYPGDVYLQIHIATRIARLGRGQEALEIFDKARDDFGINLKNWSPGIAVAYFAEGEYEQAHRQILRATSDLRFVLALKAAILGKLHMAEEAAPVIDELLATNPDIKETLYPWLTDIGWTEPLVLEVADGLAEAGLIIATDDTHQSPAYLTDN